MRAHVLLVLVLALLPGTGVAQHGYPPLPDVAISMGDCLNRRVGMPTRVFDIRTGYLIEIFLAGDPAAEQDVQTPWPRTDTVAFVELTVEPQDPGEFPAQHVMQVWRNSAPEYVVARNRGYFTFGIAGETRRCLAGALGRL